MILREKDLEKAAVIQAAERICAAARTAPKAKGIDQVRTCVLLEEDIETLAAEMERIGHEVGYGFFLRDAGNVRASQAVVLIGTTEGQRGLNESCGYCHFRDCGECAQKGGLCAYDAMDLGIAIGSMVSAATDARIDNRVMFSAGRAAAALKLLGDEVRMVIGLPLSVSGKNPYFDRKPRQ